MKKYKIDYHDLNRHFCNSYSVKGKKVTSETWVKKLASKPRLYSEESLKNCISLMNGWIQKYPLINKAYLLKITFDYLNLDFDLNILLGTFTNQRDKVKLRQTFNNLNWLNTKFTKADKQYAFKEMNSISIMAKFIKGLLSEFVPKKPGVLKNDIKKIMILRIWSHLVASGMLATEARDELGHLSKRISGFNINLLREGKRLEKLGRLGYAYLITAGIYRESIQ